MNTDKKGKRNKQGKKKKKKVDDEGDEHRDGPRGASLLHYIKWEWTILDEVKSI